MTRSSSAPTIPSIGVDRQRGVSLERQVHGAIRDAINDGRLRAGVRLPSTRQLAETLRVSRTVVVAAFDRLATEGYIRSHVGSGSYVQPGRQRRYMPSHARRPQTSRWAHIAETLDHGQTPGGALAPGMPPLDAFPRRRWIHMTARAWHNAAIPGALCPSPQGVQRLREAIADHVGAMRGIACTANDVMITGGGAQALHLLARTFADAGETVIVEDPCPPFVRAMYEAGDVLTIGRPVDREGIVVDPSCDMDARIVHVTPGAHDPTGIVMTDARRRDLLQWAAKRARIVVESGSSFATTGESVQPALKAMDWQGQVIYVASFDAILPHVSLGFMIAPSGIVDVVAQAHRFFGAMPSAIEQMAMCEFIAAGDYVRHLRRLTSLLEERRAALNAELQRAFGDAIVSISAGASFTTIVRLAPHVDDRAVVAAAQRRGVHAAALSAYSIRQPEPGLVLGCGAPATGMRNAVRVLADSIAHHEPRHPERSEGSRVADSEILRRLRG